MPKIPLWTDLLLDAKPIRAIFGPISPKLEGVDLHEIRLHRDGPRAILKFDLQDFPEHPPKKWAVAGFNKVQIQLSAFGIKELRIAGLQSNIQINLNIIKDESLVFLRTDSDSFQLHLGAEFIYIENISAYKDQA